MVQIQFDLDEKTDKMLRIYMAYNNIKSKTEAVNIILDEYFLIRPPKFEAGLSTKKKEEIMKAVEAEEAVPRDINTMPDGDILQ